MNALQSFTGTVDFKVNTTTGEAFASQRKSAELLGVSQSAVRDFCHSRNYDVTQGLSSEILSFATQYYALDARNPTPEAKALLKMTSAAGTKAFIYHQAGVQINAAPQPQFNLPTTYLEALKCLVAETEAHNETKLQLEHTTGERDTSLGLLAQTTTAAVDMLPKVKVYNTIMHSEGALLISDAARVLNMSQTKLFTFLECSRWIFRAGKHKKYKAYAPHIHNGNLVQLVKDAVNRDGDPVVTSQVQITPQGIAVLANLLVG